MMRAVIRRLSQRGRMREQSFSAIREAADGGALGSVPRSVEVEALEVGGRPAQWLLPRGASRERAILYLHGGGFISGSLRSHQPWAAQLAEGAGVPVLLLDYRLAPEHPFPAALDDVVEAYAWLRAQGIAPGSIVLAGESVGANLAVACCLAMAERDQPAPAAVVALSPWLDLRCESPSMVACADRELFYTAEELAWLRELYLAGHTAEDPLASPLLGELGSLPPTLIQASDDEMVRDDGRRLAAALEACGVAVEHREWSGVFHGFQLVGFLPESRAARAVIFDFVRRELAARGDARSEAAE